MLHFLQGSMLKKQYRKGRIRLINILLGLICFLVIVGCADHGSEKDGDKRAAGSGEPVVSSDQQKDMSAPEAAVVEGGAVTDDIAGAEATKAAEEAEKQAAALEAAEAAKEAEKKAAIEAAEAAKEEERKAAEAEKQRLIEEEQRRKIEEEKIRLAFKEMKIYEVDIEPLGLADCIRCHISQTGRLREKGGKHRRVACTDCHRQFHAYNPPKNNFSAIMPKCSFCHTLQHGEDEGVSTCLNCHFDPHQPRTVREPEKLEGQCRICHPSIGGLLDEKPSKHTERKCSECHSKKHGRKPDCTECHQNHSPQLELTTGECMQCHPVHTPLEIHYPVTQVKELCGGCHTKPYEDLRDTVTKHSALTCAKCHPKHGYLPECRECHGDQVHHAGIHEKKPVCGDCHSIAHKLDL